MPNNGAGTEAMTNEALIQTVRASLLGTKLEAELAERLDEARRELDAMVAERREMLARIGES